MRQPVPFGKYLLLDRISVGGMAEVFKAKSYGVEGFEKIIAIKRILPTMGEDRDFIKMFIDEAKIAGQLTHANICQIFELGRIDGSHFIAMEYIWGKDLLQIQNRLRKIKQPMPIAMACFTIAKVLEGLDYAHRKRDPMGRALEIVHRDCSPQNVLVSYEGEVKVIDFGIAKATSRNSRTMAGVLKGKFGYMSPEQVRGLPLDRRSDIFALGTMLYECLTGERLFQGETDFSTLEKVRNVTIRPPREINPDIPQAIEAVILKALAKDVEERYQWCSEMLADLQAFLMSQDVVFTAKSLSSWLKEVFAAEIDRERQQLEQYKRVGRDGLIDGVPAAEAKMDVVQVLGEAGPVEGDPTMLGEPSFDDLEQAAGAAPEVGPAPGSPAARGGSLDDEAPADFGEEAPTEIFGEIKHGAHPAAPSPPSSRTTPAPQPSPARPSARSPTRPPRPPPGHRAPTTRGEPVRPMAAPSGPPSSPAASPRPSQPRAIGPAPQDAGFAPAAPPQPGFAIQNDANPADAGAPYQPHRPPAPSGYTPSQVVGLPLSQQSMANTQPMALGTPGAMPLTPPSSTTNGSAPSNQAKLALGRTLLAASPPPALPSYALGHPLPSGQYPGQPQAMQAPPMPGYQTPPYLQVQQNPYVAPGQQMPGTPIESIAPPEAKKRSSIARDVAIGLAIAAVVLGGFLSAKFFLLDRETASSESSAPASSIATLRIAMPAGGAADLFLDDKKVATVSDRQEISVTPGQRKVKLVGPSGIQCEQDVNLAAGKTTPLECVKRAEPVAGTGDGSANPSVGPGDGAILDSGSGVGSGWGAGGIGQGSDDAKPADTMPDDQPVPDKTDQVPPEDKATATNKAAELAAKPAEPAAKPPGPAEKPAGPAEKPAEPADTKPLKVGDKAASKTPPKATGRKPSARPARSAAEDDVLGTLQGGSTARSEKSSALKKPADKATPNQPVRSPSDAKGYATISSNPPAKILVDGKDTGLSTPITGRALPLSPGKHKITFVIGGDKFMFPVDIKAGETTPLHKDLR